MKGKNIKKMVSAFLSVAMLQSAGTNILVTASADITNEKVNYDVEERTISEEDLSLASLPTKLLTCFDQESYNPVQIDKESYYDLYSVGTVNDDGTKSLLTFNQPIKYYNAETDSICFINNTLVADGTKYINQGNSYSMSFPEVISDGLDFSLDNYAFNMKPISVKYNEKPTVINNEIVYNGVFDNHTSVHYSLENIGFKESIIVNEPNGCSTYDFVFTSEDVIPSANTGQSITFVDDQTGEPIYVMQPTYIIDSYDGEYIEDEKHISYDNYYEIEALSDNTYLIHMNLDESFLNSDSTVYPCVIDPSVWACNFYDGSSSYVTQSGGSAYVNNQLSAGSFNGSGEHLSYVKATSVDKLRWIEPNRLISANFNVKADSTGYSNSCTINCYDSMTTASVSSVTYSGLLSSLGSLQSSTTFTTLGASYSFDVTSLFRDWISFELGEGGKNPEYGFILRGASGASTPGRWFSSTSSSDTYFSLVYQEGEEIRDGFYNIKNVSTGKYLQYNNGNQLYLSSHPSYDVCKWQIILTKSGDGLTTYGTYSISPFDDLDTTIKGVNTNDSVTTNATGNKFRIIRNGDGTFRIMPAGTNYARVSNAIGINSSNYAIIQEYSNISSMKWTFEPVVNRYYSEYTPDNINDTTGSYPTQYRMNCYGYASCNILYYGDYIPYEYYKQQPGEFASTADKPNVLPNFPSYDPDEIMDNIVHNMLLDADYLDYSLTEYNPPTGLPVKQFGANSRLIALATGTEDYHFYMQHNDGTWSHKPGASFVRNYSIDSSESSPVYLTNSNIKSLANQGYYAGGALKFFIITYRDAIVDHPHGRRNSTTAITIYDKDKAGDLMFTSRTINTGTTQACFDFYNDYDFYSFTPSSTQTYTISTTCGLGYDIDGYVYDCNGNQVTYSTSSGQVNMSFNAVSGERYYIKIYNFDEMPGEYTISVS